MLGKLDSFSTGARGQGYASEAMRLLLEHMWCTTDSIDDITADVDPRNEACLRLLSKFGFEETGLAKNTYETRLGWCDSVYLDLKRPRVAATLWRNRA